MPTILVILDAGRRDYLTSGEMPYCESLLGESTVGGFVSPPGFAQRTSMFTGTYPDKSGNFSAFGYGPERSPFRWTRALGPLMSLYRPRLAMVPARFAIKRLSRLFSGQYHTDPAWIPGRFLPFFEVVEDSKPIFDPGALPFPSVFDLCRAHGKRFFYGAHPVSGDDDEIFRLVRAEVAKPTDLVVAQFSVTDEGGHKNGPLLPPGWERAPDQTDANVAFMRRALNEVDRKIREIHEAAIAAHGEANLLVLGDHGMAPVRRRVDVLGAIRATGAKPGRDFVAFVDSTFVKLWFHDDRTRMRVTDALASADYGRILAEEEKRALRIAFTGARYGELMFAASPGVLFWPDYFHVVERPIKGMHGYVDKVEESFGAMLLHSPGAAARDVGNRSLVDVFPTLCDLVGVPATEANEGTSLLLGPRARVAREPPERAG